MFLRLNSSNHSCQFFTVYFTDVSFLQCVSGHRCRNSASHVLSLRFTVKCCIFISVYAHVNINIEQCFFFEQLGWCPPGSWCRTQTAYSAYRERGYCSEIKVQKRSHFLKCTNMYTVHTYTHICSVITSEII